MDVFKALADETRRALLDSLFTQDGQNLSELSAHFPEMTRFGVMKHLLVLEEAGLVTTLREGRTKRHFLNPVPIAAIASRWIDKYAEPYAKALIGLASGLEVRPPAQPTDALKGDLNDHRTRLPALPASIP